MRTSVPWIGLMLCILAIAVVAPMAVAKDEAAHSLASILMDAKTGVVLRENNADTRLPIASTTKIMTAILIVEHGNLDDVVTVSEHASLTGDSPLALLKGEKVPLGDLLNAILMRSANDAAVAAAEHVAGSEKKFVDMMNSKAVELGAANTHFANPHGLDAPGHYSTARDLAIITRCALQYDVINNVLVSPPVVIDRSISKTNAFIPNRDKFLDRYSGADGVKTGFTRAAGHCFVGSATRRGWRLISVVLNSTDYMQETADLLTWGYNNFRYVRVARRNAIVGDVRIGGGSPGSCKAKLASDLCVVMSKDLNAHPQTRVVSADVRAPIQAGECVGKVIATIDGEEIASVAIVSDRDIDKALFFMPPLRLVLLVGLSLGIVFAARYVSTPPQTNGRSRRRVKKNMRRSYRAWPGDG